MGAVAANDRRVLSNPFPLLRRLGFIEAVSFLVLVFVAMPLKWVWGHPEAVLVCGWIHGVLFLGFGVAWQRAIAIGRLSGRRAAAVLIAALLPFGPMVIDRRIRGWESEFLGTRGAPH